MKKVSQAGKTDANQIPGMTSVTGTNVLDRTLKNSPENEPQIRGYVTLEDVRVSHKHNMAAVPFDVFRATIESFGVVIVDGE